MIASESEIKQATSYFVLSEQDFSHIEASLVENVFFNEGLILNWVYSLDSYVKY